MQEVFLTIWTAVDQEESRFSCKAEMESSSLSAVLRYTQEGAITTIHVEETETRIEREGDYSMNLCLRKNCRTQGTLSIGGNEGVLDVSTKRIAYTTTKNSLLLQLEYTLHFGKEAQQMRLRIKATVA